MVSGQPKNSSKCHWKMAILKVSILNICVLFVQNEYKRM